MDEGLAWIDMAGLAVLAGIGFTVSLLIGELAFSTGQADTRVKIAVLAGSLAAALLATMILRLRARLYRRIHQAETADSDHDGIPDLYQQTKFFACGSLAAGAERKPVPSESRPDRHPGLRCLQAQVIGVEEPRNSSYR
ncbi:Na+/H+ antiporter NhaA [Nonomuraea sp. NPDC051941]|uniref:Na+/H+ antiporter NhaA n=1 Tax=Nonomuraea sp. NPDC051941 TaxID=3364373 RepID=UPI0037CAF721